MLRRGVVHRLATQDYALPLEVQEALCSPALVLYATKIRRNIDKVLAASGGRWRPHIKTVKCDAVFGMLLDAGVRRFKCATPREARTLCAALDARGVVDGDVLVAFPHVGPNLATLEEIRKATSVRLSVLVEDATPTSLDVFFDVNPGMDRSGAPLSIAADVLADVRRATGPRFRGVHCYDGHATRLGNSRSEWEPELFKVYDDLLRLVEPGDEVVTAGTPAMLSSLAHPGLRSLDDHTVSPGTVVLSDMNCEEQLPELGLEPAALVFSRVISRPTEDVVTADAGVKALAADAGHPMACVVGHPEWVPLKPSEEHLPIRVPTDARPHRGHPLYLVPRHVCPTVNLAENALLVDNDGDSFSVVNINARAHDLLRDPKITTLIPGHAPAYTVP